MKMSLKELKFKRALLTALSFLILFTGCSRLPEKAGEKPLARVYDKYLYPSDMSGIFTAASNSEDSVKIVGAFINQWIRKQLLVRHAEFNVPARNKNFETMLEDYRASLLIYEYEKQLVREKVDTLVTNSQIEDYYEKNLQSFKLDKPVVKALYMRMEKSNSKVPDMKRLIQSNSDRDFEQMLSIGQQQADRFDFFNDEWASFPLIMEKIPGTPENLDEFLQGSSHWISEDQDYIHFLLIRDYLKSGQIAPVEYIREQIKGLVLSRRKLDYIEQIQNEVLQDAMSGQQIEIYEQNK